MAGIQGALETAAVPLSRLHGRASHDLADFAVPTGREEEWRFTPLRRLRGLHSSPPDGAAGIAVTADAPPEVRVEVADRADQRLGRTYVPTDRVSALAFSSFRAATVVTVPTDTVASRPIVLSLHPAAAPPGGAPQSSAPQPTAGAGPVPASFGHLLVRVEPLASAVLVLDHSGSATYADNVEFAIGDGASLSVVSVQGWAGDTVHLSHHHAELGRDARFKHMTVTLGGDVVRIAPSVHYAGPGGDAELLGIYFTDAGQHFEHRLFVDHAVRDCRSRVKYKGALQGDGAHAVWIGDVIIQPEATGTDTYEYNRNLVLTDGTRVDSVPNLEILTGEVNQAGHASASGRLEDVHLFYLMARGIPYEEARRLVIRGFFGELIERIDVAAVRHRVAGAVEAELARSAHGQLSPAASAPATPAASPSATPAAGPQTTPSAPQVMRS